MTGMVVGIDFDNTIISYDDVMHRLACERGLIGADVKPSKKHIRDQIRLRLAGDREWQRLQAEVYGPRIDEAQLVEGVPEFFDACRRRGVRVQIISHKTRFSAFDLSRTNLRAAATAWLDRRGFFDTGGLGLRREDVFYEETRAAKIARLRTLGCTHFIDDLEETFAEVTFPPDVSKVLFDPHGASVPPPDVRACASWWEIRDYVLDASG